MSVSECVPETQTQGPSKLERQLASVLRRALTDVGTALRPSPPREDVSLPRPPPAPHFPPCSLPLDTLRTDTRLSIAGAQLGASS